VIIVSNTSPIINLAAVGKLDLLKKQFGKIVIPRAVYNEITIEGRGEPGDSEVRTSDWIEVIEVEDIPLLAILKRELDDGEAESIALTVSLKADLLLIDETDARSIASNLGLRFIGLLGVLVKAKEKGYVKEVKPVMDRLKKEAGFWIDEKLYRYILETVEEKK
jgi:predicted nucleic acid-binding protein